MTTTTNPLTRQHLINTMYQALRAIPTVHAAWLGGSDATGRTDVYSDVDCQALVDDEAVEAVFTAVTAALSALSPIDRQYRIPEPTWHGHSQVFFRLQDAPPWLLVDLAVLKMSSSPPTAFWSRSGTAVSLCSLTTTAWCSPHRLTARPTKRLCARAWST